MLSLCLQHSLYLVMSVCVHILRCIQTYKLITLCAYAQQGYAFGCVGLCFLHTMYMYICILCRQKNRLFSALPFENLLRVIFACMLFEIKCLQCGLLHTASCTDRAIHAFPNKVQRPLAPKYFLLSFNGTPHPLCCHNSFNVMHVCMQTCACSAKRQQLVLEPSYCTCSTLKCMLSVHRVCACTLEL